MTDKEIVKQMKVADALLAEYRTVVAPIAAALAHKKSMAVYGRPNCYSGDLGCYEAGTDTVCLHLNDREQGKEWRYDGPHRKKAADFDFKWSNKLRDAGIRSILLSGFM